MATAALDNKAAAAQMAASVRRTTARQNSERLTATNNTVAVEDRTEAASYSSDEGQIVRRTGHQLTETTILDSRPCCDTHAAGLLHWTEAEDGSTAAAATQLTDSVC